MRTHGPVLVFCCLFWAGAALAAPATAQLIEPQAPPTLVEVRLEDGSTIYGTVETEDPDRLVIRTLAGARLEVERHLVASVEPARGTVVDGQFVPSDANATRLMFSPTGRSLRKGEGYIGVYEFLLPFVQVGVTDRLSLGVGTPLVFFGDETGRPVWVSPKYQVYRRESISAAAGVLHFQVFGENARAGLAYGVATVGSDDNAWTIGAGWAYSRYYEDEYPPSCWAPPSPRPCEPERVVTIEGSPVLMVGGERRLSRRLKVLSENYAFEGGGIASVGVRFLGDRLSADLGAGVPIGIDAFVVLPVINFVWTFGR